MVLSIKDPEADRLARAVAERTGETLTQAVINALREKLARAERPEAEVESRVADALEIARHFHSLPVIDPRSPDEILGYDENGLPQVIVDTCAFIAILEEEPEAERLARAIGFAARR